MKKLIDFIKKILAIEFIRYLIGGGSVTLLNFFLYVILLYFGVVYHLANLISIVVAKIYGYFINKFFVYKSKRNNILQTAKESFKYAISRAITGVLDYVLVILFVETFNFNKIAVKIFVMIIVIVLNYTLGKFWVFKN